MSTEKTLTKRASQINYMNSEGAPRKKNKIKEEVDTPTKDSPIEIVSKQPIIAPNGKIFYPCQHCSKIFPQKTTSITHMKKCPIINNVLPLDSKNVNKTECSINNNREQLSEVEENGNLNSSGSSNENKPPGDNIRITQNVLIKESYPAEKQVHDASVYDYNEEDSDIDKDEEEDVLNNKLCKHCKTIFDNPLDLLRHVRDCHNFPRTILPPDEIEKYFDSPNRSFCPVCEKPIKTRNFRSVFIKHLLVHTTGLTHECSICKKKFRRRDHMRAHEKRHIVSV